MSRWKSTCGRITYCPRTNHPTVEISSTETVILDVLSDAYAAADAGKVTLLGMLGQCSAFDVVDHGILLKRLQHGFGVTGMALKWIRSYLSGRTQYVV